jgi:hypothetical protein
MQGMFNGVFESILIVGIVIGILSAGIGYLIVHLFQTGSVNSAWSIIVVILVISLWFTNRMRS